MNRILLLAFIASLLTLTAFARAPVTVTIETNSIAAPIPADFVGLSFGMKALLPDKDGNHFFSPANQPLVTLFQNLGISHLRVGGTTVESPPETPIPDHAAIDDLFAFVKAAGVKKIIYSFRLLETNTDLHYDATNAALAKYIWDNHRAYLDCFALGNEPDLARVFKQDIEITNFATYLAKWRRFAAAITNAVPAAKFAGPDAGSGNIKWTTNFAAKEKDSGILAAATEHFYVGGAGRDVTPAQGIADMLSKKWITTNEKLYEKMAAPILKLGIPYRFTEANDHYTGGVKDASDTFAGALWALDFLHWWAAHGAIGVNFHNTQWVVNDVVTLDSNHQPVANPKGYGLRAFELGCEGTPESVKIRNPREINLTAYAVHSPTAHYITLINKAYGTNASSAEVTIPAPPGAKNATVVFLIALNNDASAKAGVTLGGSAIGNQELWHANWKPLPTPDSGKFTINVPATSAAIVKISTQ